ncbi:MAG: HD domain-containing protein [Candidatus Taylorbacteria bacterium]
MKNIENSPIPKEVLNTVHTLEKAGFQAYLVGGCVRDLFLGRIPKDWDITTNAKPEDIQGLFVKTVYENTFGTVAVVYEDATDEKLKIIEVTPYRTEMGYSDRRHPDKVSFSDKIEDDLKRRDFTVNAIAINLSKDAIKDTVDLFGGFADIKDKIIRTVGKPDDRFTEDALRMMRAVRLSVELGFTVEKSTLDSIKNHNALIKAVSMERIRDEFSKIIMSASPKRGIELLHETGLLKHIVPELEAGLGVTQNQAHAFDVWEHLLRSLQAAADKNWSLDIRLIALFHDISKPKTKGLSRETGIITFYGHEVVGSRETRKILERMKFSRVIIEKVTKLVRWHMFFSDTEQISLSAVRRMVVNVGKENIWDLMNVRICDRIGTGRPKEDPYRLRKYHAMIEEALRDPISVKMLKINGKVLNDKCSVSPGPRMGNILHALFNEVLDDPKLNTAEYLESKAIELNKLSDQELQTLGEQGKEKKEEVDEEKIKEIRKKHHVS